MKKCLFALFLLVTSKQAYSQATIPPPLVNNSGGGGGGGGTLCVGSTSPNAPTCPGVPSPTSYGNSTTGYISGVFIPGATNTGPMTLAIAGLTPSKTALLNGNAITSGQIIAGIPLTYYYDGANINFVFSGASEAYMNFAMASFPPGDTLGSTANWENIANDAGTLTTCTGVATIAPTGSAMIYDIRKNGTSVMGGNPFLTIPIGSTTFQFVSVFATTAVARGDILQAVNTQTDSGSTGQFVQIKCTLVLPGGTGPPGPQGAVGAQGPAGAGSDPTNMEQPFWQYWATDNAGFVRGGTCSGSGGQGTVGAGPVSIYPWQFNATTGAATVCAVYTPSTSSGYGTTMADVFSGGTPVQHQMKVRAETKDRNANLFVGYSQSNSNFTNSFGCEALTTDTDWFAYIENAGTVTRTDTGVAVVISVTPFDTTGGTLFNINNGAVGAPVANSITCLVNGVGATAAATIPPAGGGWYRIHTGAVQVGATANVTAWSWIGARFTGVGTVQ